MSTKETSETRTFRNYFNANTPLNQRAQGNTSIDSLAQIARFIDDNETINAVFEGKHNDLSAPISEYLEALIQAMLNMRANEDEVDDVLKLHNKIDSKPSFIGGSPMREKLLEDSLAFKYFGDSDGYNKAFDTAVEMLNAGISFEEVSKKVAF